MKVCMRRSDTHASISPFSTQGNALSGVMSRLNSAILVNTYNKWFNITHMINQSVSIYNFFLIKFDLDKQTDYPHPWFDLTGV